MSLAYNIGTGQFARSSVLRFANVGRFAEAADGFKMWNRVGDRVLEGLVRRREAERRLFLRDPAAVEESDPSTYTVRRGDTLGAIARRLGTSVQALVSTNRISNPNRISPGQVLKIPGRGGGGSPAAPPPPPPQPRPAAKPRAREKTYRVRGGDNLGVIARRFGTTVSAIAKANGISNPNRIRVGQVLKIPGNESPAAPSPAPRPRPLPGTSSTGAKTYTIRRGDNLGSIARRFGTTVSAIARANGISNPNRIRAGQTLRIP